MGAKEEEEEEAALCFLHPRGGKDDGAPPPSPSLPLPSGVFLNLLLLLPLSGVAFKDPFRALNTLPQRRRGKLHKHSVE